MTEYEIENILTIGIRIGTVATIKRLGLTGEIVSVKEAYSLYSRRTVENWRKNKWINLYSTGGTSTSKNYYKRSELEIASARMDLNNIIKVNNIHKEIME